ncbi:transposase [Methylobacter sp. BBA5.1]|uniref:transposase n=1 Tax=Methylobacter sp. BBA5.1 TaxID=1495064 RepID=UPI0035107738
MTDYRRIYALGSTWFFTVNLAERRNNYLLVEKIDLLRAAFRYVKERKPYRINAIVIQPDHLHCIWTLPPGRRGFFHTLESAQRSFFPCHAARRENFLKPEQTPGTRLMAAPVLGAFIM